MEITFKSRGYVISATLGPYTADGAVSADGIGFANQLIDALPATKSFAATALLNTYNNSWIDEAHGALTEDQFASNLCQPKIVLLDEIGAASIYFGDSDMFGGHYIDIMIRNGQPLDAQIVG